MGEHVHLGGEVGGWAVARCAPFVPPGWVAWPSSPRPEACRPPQAPHRLPSPPHPPSQRYWPQASEPLSAEHAAYVAALDAEADLAALAAAGLPLRPGCATTLRVCTALLQAAARRCLAPADVAGVMSRDTPDARSPLEVLLATARRSAAAAGRAAGDDVGLMAALHPLLEEYLDGLEPGSGGRPASAA